MHAIDQDSNALAASPIHRRLGLAPQARGSATNCSCPDIFELDNGNFAVIGTDRTQEYKDKLLADAAIGEYERIVVITRATLLAAKNDIPDS